MKLFLFQAFTGLLLFAILQLHACVGEKQVTATETTTFFNDSFMKELSLKENAGTLWEFLFNDNERKPKTSLPYRTVDLSHFTTAVSEQLNATWLGHSTELINIDGYRIITDPVFEECVSVMGPKRFNGPVPLDINELPEVHAVIISHNHYDHLNKYSIRFLTDRTKMFIVPARVGATLKEWGVPPEKIVELNWWQTFDYDKNFSITATPAQHFSGRGLRDRNKTLWASFVIQGPDHRIFFSGDSGYFDGFKQIGDKYGPFDITFIECGAYHENWRHLHMFPEETVQAHRDLNGTILHPVHWGTFNLSLHPWYEPMRRLAAAAAASNVRAVTPVTGETTVFDGCLPQRKWWEDVLGESR